MFGTINDKGILGQLCTEFLTRTASGELKGFTSTLVISETIHKVMVSEAAKLLRLSSSARTIEYLQKHPKTVQQLKRHLQVASDVYRGLGIKSLPVTYKELHTSKNIRSNWGLMTNDSLIVAVMQMNKLQNLATHDAGFARVPSIQVFRPR